MTPAVVTVRGGCPKLDISLPHGESSFSWPAGRDSSERVFHTTDPISELNGMDMAEAESIPDPRSGHSAMLGDSNPTYCVARIPSALHIEMIWPIRISRSLLDRPYILAVSRYYLWLAGVVMRRDVKTRVGALWGHAKMILEPLTTHLLLTMNRKASTFPAQ